MRQAFINQRAGETDDKRIATEISRRLERHTILENPREMTIIVSSGVVYLYGHVSMHSEKQMIDDIVRATKGVTFVRNHLKIIYISPSRAPSSTGPL